MLSVDVYNNIETLGFIKGLISGDFCKEILNGKDSTNRLFIHGAFATLNFDDDDWLDTAEEEYPFAKDVFSGLQNYGHLDEHFAKLVDKLIKLSNKMMQNIAQNDDVTIDTSAMAYEIWRQRTLLLYGLTSNRKYLFKEGELDQIQLDEETDSVSFFRNIEKRIELVYNNLNVYKEDFKDQWFENDENKNKPCYTYTIPKSFIDRTVSILKQKKGKVAFNQVAYRFRGIDKIKMTKMQAKEQFKKKEPEVIDVDEVTMESDLENEPEMEDTNMKMEIDREKDFDSDSVIETDEVFENNKIFLVYTPNLFFTTTEYDHSKKTLLVTISPLFLTLNVEESRITNEWNKFIKDDFNSKILQKMNTEDATKNKTNSNQVIDVDKDDEREEDEHDEGLDISYELIIENGRYVLPSKYRAMILADIYNKGEKYSSVNLKDYQTMDDLITDFKKDGLLPNNESWVQFMQRKIMQFEAIPTDTGGKKRKKM
jgi:hypothetical protein